MKSKYITLNLQLETATSAISCQLDLAKKTGRPGCEDQETGTMTGITIERGYNGLLFSPSESEQPI